MENIINYLVQAIINTAALHTSSGILLEYTYTIHTLLEYTSFDT